MIKVAENIMNNRHMFPGGNTADGFTNYFEGIFPCWEENKKLYILKGGPGVGKNTLMRQLGLLAEDKGYPVEYFHCASDADSLDAVRIPMIGIAMLDGTAPHIVDPVYPGAVDQIYNLGVFLNESYLRAQKDEIIKLGKENSFCYERTFCLLKAAGILNEYRSRIFQKALSHYKLQADVKDIFSSPINTPSQKFCPFRKLFYSAITPAGKIDYAPKEVDCEKLYYLDGPNEMASLYLKQILLYAQNSGYSGEIFCSPVLPEEILHLNIRELNISFTTTKPFSTAAIPVTLSDYWDADFIHTQNETLSYLSEQSDSLIEAAHSSLKESKQIHDAIEAIYNDGIDFEALTVYTKQIINDIF